MKTAAIFLLAVFAAFTAPAFGQVSLGPLPQEVAGELLRSIYIPADIKSAISITFIDAPTFTTVRGTAIGTYQSLRTYIRTPEGYTVEARELRRGAIKIAVSSMRTIEGVWDITAISNFLAHEIGHAAWDLKLTEEAKGAFRKITPELHEQSLFEVQSKSDYRWRTHREEYFAETWKALFCVSCSLGLDTDWRFPVTAEVIAFYKQYFGGVWREPKPEETVP